jgi:hypothetical protein
MCAPADPAASTFLKQLLAELTKVSGFYVEQAQQLEVRAAPGICRGQQQAAMWIVVLSVPAIVHPFLPREHLSVAHTVPYLEHLQGVTYCG